MSGDNFIASCESGTMSVEACYAEKSRFLAIHGHMDLKNVHKQSEVHLPDGGSLTMTGVDGRLIAKTVNGRVYIQFSRLVGTSVLDIDHPEHSVVNLSENMEKEATVVASGHPLIIDDDLVALKENIIGNGSLESWVDGEDAPALVITSSGSLRIGRESRIDSIKLQTK